MTTQAFDLGVLFNRSNVHYQEPWMIDAINSAPVYQQFARGARHVIECVHAVPALHNKCSLGEVEIYIGRAGRSAKHVLNRWFEHYSGKEHKFGIVALVCPTEYVGIWETAAVRAVSALKNRGRLCVRNISTSGFGPLPSTEESCIYVTWNHAGHQNITTPNRSDIDAIASSIASQMKHAISKSQLITGLDSITRPVHSRADVDWHPHHK